MKKLFRAILAVFSLVMIIGILYVVPVQAASKIISVKFGKTYKQKESESTYFKITMPKDGVLEVKSPMRPSLGAMGIYKTLKLKDERARISSSIDYVYLKSGTYYLDSWSLGGTFKFLYRKKPANKSNYCMDKAISLPKSKNVIVVQKGNMKYDRWYKIKLTKKKAITYTTNRRDWITLYDSKGNIIDTTYDDYDKPICHSSNRLKKGVYYFKIGVGYYDMMETNQAYVRSLVWK